MPVLLCARRGSGDVRPTPAQRWSHDRPTGRHTGPRGPGRAAAEGGQARPAGRGAGLATVPTRTGRPDEAYAALYEGLGQGRVSP